MARTKICPYCEKEFVPVSDRQKYCCEKCRTMYHRGLVKLQKAGMLEPKKCEVCGAVITKGTNRKRYCSKRCAYEAEKKRKREERAWQEPKSKKHLPPKMTISEICAAAAKEHLTYGQYVTKYGL